VFPSVSRLSHPPALTSLISSHPEMRRVGMQHAYKRLKLHMKLRLENLKATKHLGHPDIDKNIILIWMLRKWGWIHLASKRFQKLANMDNTYTRVCPYSTKLSGSKLPLNHHYKNKYGKHDTHHLKFLNKVWVSCTVPCMATFRSVYFPT
jgi:hypothetical protein